MNASMRPRPIPRKTVVLAARYGEDHVASMRPRPIPRKTETPVRPIVNASFRFNEAAADTAENGGSG